jgi:hypothetical protein
MLLTEDYLVEWDQSQLVSLSNYKIKHFETQVLFLYI